MFHVELRDFARVVFGVLMADTESMTEGQQGVRLWVHEILRVFYDRLTDDKDRSWLIEFIRDTLKKNFSFDLNKIMEHLLTEEDGGQVQIPQIRRLLFGDFGNPEGKRVYAEMREPQAVIDVCNTFLDDYNAMSKKPMPNTTRVVQPCSPAGGGCTAAAPTAKLILPKYAKMPALRLYQLGKVMTQHLMAISGKRVLTNSPATQKQLGNTSNSS